MGGLETALARVAHLQQAATVVQQALELAEQVLRESIEAYQGRNQTVRATTGGDFGRALQRVRQALEMNAYVPPWDVEAEAFNEAQMPLGLDWGLLDADDAPVGRAAVAISQPVVPQPSGPRQPSGNGRHPGVSRNAV